MIGAKLGKSPPVDLQGRIEKGVAHFLYCGAIDISNVAPRPTMDICQSPMHGIINHCSLAIGMLDHESQLWFFASLTRRTLLPAGRFFTQTTSCTVKLVSLGQNGGYGETAASCAGFLQRSWGHLHSRPQHLASHKGEGDPAMP